MRETTLAPAAPAAPRQRELPEAARARGGGSVLRKIVLSFFIVMAISMTMILTWVSLLTRRRLMEQQSHKAEIVCTNLAASCADPLMVGERDRLSKILQSAKESDPDIAYATLVGNDGKCVASTDDRQVDTYLNFDEFDKAALHAEQLLRQTHPVKKRVFEVAVPVILTGDMRMGVLRMGYTTRNIIAIIRAGAALSASIAVLSLVLGGFLFTWLVRRGIVEPLSRLMEAAERISRGDLTVKNVGYGGTDEIGQLAVTFDRMIRLLADLVRRIKLTASSVAESSQSLAQASRLANDATVRVAEMISEVTRTVSSISTNAQSANAFAQDTNVLSRKDRELVKRLADKMQGIQGGASGSVDAINTLQKHSSRIAEIVEVITTIAGKTNLLALNAAIEAARAGGVSGRSFAVVADQVRKLAESSSTQAQEIAKLVSQIQRETQSAVRVTEGASKEAEEGGELMAETDHSLEKILESVDNATSQIAQIARSVQDLAASANQASQSSQEQTNVVERVSSSAQSLNATAAELNQLVERFRV